MVINIINCTITYRCEDLRPAKDAVKAAGLHTPIIAKIEHPAALKNLHSILDIADAVMVARGDLGVEIPLERVPLAQQMIIDAGLMRGMVVIVATQMLESMTLNPRPTRAEVSDVSTAIRQGSTAVMLSGETASGNQFKFARCPHVPLHVAISTLGC